jgi:hypothetical protein
VCTPDGVLVHMLYIQYISFFPSSKLPEQSAGTSCTTAVQYSILRGTTGDALNGVRIKLENAGLGVCTDPIGSDQAAFSVPHDQHVQMHAFWEGACLKLREKGDLFGALSCNRKRGKPLGH